jgi:hypothetical protein
MATLRQCASLGASSAGSSASFDRRHAVRQLDGGQLAAVDDE